MNLYALHPHAPLKRDVTLDSVTTVRASTPRLALTPFRTADRTAHRSLRHAEIPSPPASQPPPPEVTPPAPPRPDVQPPEITDPPPSDVPLPVREPPGMPPPMAAAA